MCTIVGVGPGIGLSVARRFAEGGFDIAMIARNEGHLQSYAQLLQEYGTTISYAIADAAKADELTRALSNFSKETDVLIYNAAVVEKSSIDVGYQKLLDDLCVNVAGALVSVQQILPSMQMKGKGTILFTGGGFAHEPDQIHNQLKKEWQREIHIKD